jgi:hypothetical protein
MKDEALRLALEALEEIAKEATTAFEDAWCGDIANDTLTAIKEALEQPKSNDNWAVVDCPVCGIGAMPQPPKHEPLTDEWIERFWLDHPTPIKFARAIEAAHGIKEKNI